MIRCRPGHVARMRGQIPIQALAPAPAGAQIVLEEEIQPEPHLGPIRLATAAPPAGGIGFDGFADRPDPLGRGDDHAGAIDPVPQPALLAIDADRGGAVDQVGGGGGWSRPAAGCMTVQQPGPFELMAGFDELAGYRMWRSVLVVEF